VQLTETIDTKLIKDILTNPRLFAVSNGIDIIPKNYEVDKHWDYLLIHNHKHNMGLISLKQFTPLVIETHIHLLPEFWGKENISLDAAKLGLQWIRDNTKFRQTFTYVPLVCENVHVFLKELEYKPCGIIENGCVFNGMYMNLILYTYDLKRESNE